MPPAIWAALLNPLRLGIGNHNVAEHLDGLCEAPHIRPQIDDDLKRRHYFCDTIWEHIDTS